MPNYLQYFGIPLAKRKIVLTWDKTFLYTLYITHYQAYYTIKIVQTSFDILKKKALPLQYILGITIKI